jgi:predicted PolB exonuclease-like 3'-5' exonuclease
MNEPHGDGGNSTAPTDRASPARYLVLDTESIPDGQLLAKVKYAGENLTDQEAVARAQGEARAKSATGSDLLPVTFQYPVAVCIIRVGADLTIQALTCLDAPRFETPRIVEGFWKGAEHYSHARLVTFNGRGFDLPLLEFAAFRYGCSARGYYRNGRKRFNGNNHLDLLEWLTNYGACRLDGGLNLFSKLLGKPGKMEVSGSQVYQMFLDKRLQEINDYCMYDTIDTYFVFLRTRVLTGECTLEHEQELVKKAKDWLTTKSSDFPALQKYLDSWGDWQPWP